MLSTRVLSRLTATVDVQHIGARAGSRTLNLGIKSPLLCQLSYASVEPTVDSKVPRPLTAGVPTAWRSRYGASRASPSAAGRRPRGQAPVWPHSFTSCIRGARSAERICVVVIAVGSTAGSCRHVPGGDRNRSGGRLGSMAGSSSRCVDRRHRPLRHEHPSGGMEQALEAERATRLQRASSP